MSIFDVQGNKHAAAGKPGGGQFETQAKAETGAGLTGGGGGPGRFLANDPFHLDDDGQARVLLSVLTEPGDDQIDDLVREVGYEQAAQALIDSDGDAVARAEEALLVHHETGGSVLSGPDDPRWPDRLVRMTGPQPHMLWVRGEPDLNELLNRSVTVTGSRASTDYGNHVAREIAGDLAGAGVTIAAGGGYGIDDAAHQAAMVAGGRTVVFAAAGIDRSFPTGTATTIEQVPRKGGAVVSEYGPGRLPNRARFARRTELMAAATGATLVVEAAARSGALRAAQAASGCGSPVGAVPGPVTSASSTGTNQLIRDRVAVAVTDTNDARRLLRG